MCTEGFHAEEVGVVESQAGKGGNGHRYCQAVSSHLGDSGEKRHFFLPVSNSIPGNNCDGSGLSHTPMSWPIAVVRGMGYSDCLNLGDVHTPEARESEVLFG